MAKIITLTGASASGKDSLLKALLGRNKDMKPAVSVTTRPMRQGEVNGVDYHFITPEELQKISDADGLIEVRHYNTENGVWYYGLTKDSIDLESDITYVVVLDVNGVVQLKQYLNSLEDDKTEVQSYFINCSSQLRLKRSLERQGNMTDSQVYEVCRRMYADRDEVIRFRDLFDVIIRNEDQADFDRCVNIIEKLA